MADNRQESFAELYTDFLRTVVGAAQPADTPVVETLRAHFGADPTTLAAVSRGFPDYERPNLQIALDGWLAQRRRQHSLVGFTRAGYGRATFSGLLSSPGPLQPTLRFGPVDYSSVPIGLNRTMQCVQLGLYLVREGKQRFGILVNGPGENFNPQPHVSIEVVATGREAAGAVLESLAGIARSQSVYRGQVVSIHETNFGGVNLEFHQLPSVQRDDIVLSPGVLERIEAHTIGFSAHAARLRAAQRHLRRGLLLYGPPGTGKTFSIMYLIRQMPEHTIILLAGGDMSIRTACRMARQLAPSLVVLEDVDLVAEDRTRSAPGRTPLLFSLMNEMDGLDDDEDVIFVLTTNRADLLEPALAARPGRVDEAVEIGLPDPSCRRRLIGLYGEGLDLRLSRLDHLVERMEGVSAAFIKELMRKAALGAAERNGARRRLVIDDELLESALTNLEQGGTTLRRALVGGAASEAAAPR